MKIFGLTRYSVLAGVGLKQTRDLSYDQRAAQVFTDERLDRRQKLFDAFVAPELRSMSSRYRDYCHILLVSPEMPAQWLNRLRETMIGIRHEIVPVSEDENVIYKSRDTVTEMADGGAFFSFRVDDDDALPSGYLDVILENMPDRGSLALSCDDGYFVKKLSPGKFLVDHRTVPLIAIGLGLYVSRGEKPKTVFCLGNHMKIHEQVEVAHVKAPNWLRTVHGTNDSRLKLPTGDKYSESRLFKLLKSEFPTVNPQKIADAL